MTAVPGGQALLFTADYLEQERAAMPAPLQLVPLSGGTPKDLVTGLDVRYPLSFAAGGTKVIFTTPKPAPSTLYELRSVDLATGTMQILSDRVA